MVPSLHGGLFDDHFQSRWSIFLSLRANCAGIAGENDEKQLNLLLLNFRLASTVQHRMFKELKRRLLNSLLLGSNYQGSAGQVHLILCWEKR